MKNFWKTNIKLLKINFRHNSRRSFEICETITLQNNLALYRIWQPLYQCLYCTNKIWIFSKVTIPRKQLSHTGNAQHDVFFQIHYRYNDRYWTLVHLFLSNLFFSLLHAFWRIPKKNLATYIKRRAYQRVSKYIHTRTYVYIYISQYSKK